MLGQNPPGRGALAPKSSGATLITFGCNVISHDGHHNSLCRQWVYHERRVIFTVERQKRPGGWRLARGLRVLATLPACKGSSLSSHMDVHEHLELLVLQAPGGLVAPTHTCRQTRYTQNDADADDAYNMYLGRRGRRIGVQGHPQLLSEFEASLSYETQSQKNRSNRK